MRRIFLKKIKAQYVQWRRTHTPAPVGLPQPQLPASIKVCLQQAGAADAKKNDQVEASPGVPRVNRDFDTARGGRSFFDSCLVEKSALKHPLAAKCNGFKVPAAKQGVASVACSNKIGHVERIRMNRSGDDVINDSCWLLTVAASVEISLKNGGSGPSPR